MPQVTLTYTFASEQEALDFLAGRNPEKGDKPAGKSAPKAEAAASSPSADKKEPAKTAAPAKDPAPAPAEGKPVAYADSGLPALIKEAVGRDREGVVALLKKFGAAKGDQLKPEQFEAFRAEIVTVGAGGDLA